MTAAVPLALAVLEDAVPLADFDSDFDSELVVLDAASDVFVGDALEDAEVVSLFESSCLRRIKPSISLYDGGHGQAEVMEVRRKKVNRMWLSRSCWNMTSGRAERPRSGSDYPIRPQSLVLYRMSSSVRTVVERGWDLCC